MKRRERKARVVASVESLGCIVRLVEYGGNGPYAFGLERECGYDLTGSKRWKEFGIDEREKQIEQAARADLVELLARRLMRRRRKTKK